MSNVAYKHNGFGDSVGGVESLFRFGDKVCWELLKILLWFHLVQYPFFMWWVISFPMVRCEGTGRA